MIHQSKFTQNSFISFSICLNFSDSFKAYSISKCKVVSILIFQCSMNVTRHNLFWTLFAVLGKFFFFFFFKLQFPSPWYRIMIHKISPGENRGCSCGEKRDNNNDDDKKCHSTYGLHSIAKLKGCYYLRKANSC